MSNTTPVVVIEEKKRRKAAAFIAVGAVAVAAAGGSTFALWSAQDTFSGGNITAGDLNVVKVLDTAWYDVSGDRTDATETLTGTDGSQPGHKITEISDWRIVPGDKVAADFTAAVTLEGDNLVGKLDIQGMDANALNNSGMTYTYEVYQEGKLLVAEKALPTEADATVIYLSAPGTGQAAGQEDANGTTVFPMANKTEAFTVVVYGEFDDATADRDQVTVADTLGTIELGLEQVRDTGAVFN